MLLTIIREKFHRYSDMEDINKCFERFNFGFIPFSRKFKEQELDESDHSEEEKFNIKNWTVENNKIVWKGE